jgi:predicted signal transduction protein with EAL and GGDEF domain
VTAAAATRTCTCTTRAPPPVWVRSAPLHDPDGTIVGAVEVFSDDTAATTARAQVRELEQLALTDQLTGLGNRRYLEMQLRTRFHKWARYGSPFGVLIADIDWFKRVNDTYGHDIGDETLAMVARTASEKDQPAHCNWDCNCNRRSPVAWGKPAGQGSRLWESNPRPTHYEGAA